MARDAKALLAETEKAQALASDPTASVWVSANAGAGKTHVLKSRVLRILLAGTAPDRILCLTYTKAAAAEMAARVFKDLSAWATAADDELRASLSRLLSRSPSREETRTARALFARAIETPGGLKVQTIHAFCERLLQRFPLEAGVPPGFAILDDAEGARLSREAVDAVLTEATGNPDGPLGIALTRVVAFAAGDAFDTVLRNALAERDWLDAVVRMISHEDEGEAVAERIYRRALGIRKNATQAGIEREMAASLSREDLARAIVALAEGGKNDGKLADALRSAAAAEDDATKAGKLRKALLTAKDEPRADNFVSKGVQAARPDTYTALCRARDRIARLVDERHGLAAMEASLALMRLAGDVQQHYTEAKQRRAALDVQDLIDRTARLLADGEAAAWVLLKLDGGLEHILVDEAQDTSPVQWRIIDALAAEFFPVTGGTARPRTIFAVGDEKQSIYSFQGAEPRRFAEAGDNFRQAAEAARVALHKVPLTLSFRTVEPLLAAVDRVMGDRARVPGLTTGDTSVAHVALRLGHAGCLEIWETEKPAEVETADAWLPLGDKPPALPVNRLADRIAATIADWLARKEPLASEGRPLRAGDILILLRRRHPFAGPMVAALKSRGIAVAGADRLRLVDQLAVRDLMVLGDFLTLPEDELALATVLKSPLFGLNDDDLLRLCVERRGQSLWSRLLAAARTEPRFAEAAETLRRWRGVADQAPPFEFFAHVLDREGVRKKLIGRLGPESVETLTELLNLAIEFDEAETPSLTGFLQWVRDGAREIKRDMEQGRDEVRVLTVHGAKGLEAPVVFLPDTCAGIGSQRQGSLVRLPTDGVVAGPRHIVAWPVKGTSGLSAIKTGKELAQRLEREESNRLLYVAMTRARDRLYVCGWEGKKKRAPDCWYDLIADGLADVVVEGKDVRGEPVRRITSRQTAKPGGSGDLAAAVVAAIQPPDWARAPAPREPQLAIPLAPSRLAPYDVDETGDPAPPAATPGATPQEPPSPSPLRLAGSNRFQRGLITHALLEHLPAVAPQRWQDAAEAFVDSRGHMLPKPVRSSIVSEVLALLQEPSFAAAFGPDSRAEVPLVAEIPAAEGRGPPLRLNAVIDRLVVERTRVLIIDYKTNRPPPAEPDGIPAAYLLQLAAYRLALRRIHPARQVHAAILWTDGARLMEIPATMLDRAERELWQLAEARLDGR